MLTYKQGINNNNDLNETKHARANDWKERILDSDIPILLALLFLILLFSLTTKGFLSLSNLETILTQVSILGIISVGATLVILISGIDLSNGSIVALSGVLTASWALKGLPVGLAIIACVFIGLIIGLFNGLAIYALGMAPFIVTLATMSMVAGLALVYSDGQTFYGYNDALNFIGAGSLLGIPFSIILLLLVFLVAWYVLNYTSFGRNIYAIGGNAQAAKLSGVRVQLIGISVFTIAGGLAGLASLIQMGRLSAATPIAGTGMELQAIAAVVIGGTSLFGGVGRLTGTFIGVLIIGVLNNGLSIADISAFWQGAIQGFVIFLAVVVDATVNRGKKQ